MKPLNLTAADRAGVTVTFSVNRFEAYAANGALLIAASTKAGLKEQLSLNGITGAKFDGIAQRKYLAG